MNLIINHYLHKREKQAPLAGPLKRRPPQTFRENKPPPRPKKVYVKT